MRLRDLREDGDYTQSHLAQLLNIRQNTYSQYENGQRQLPIDVLIRLAEFFQEVTDQKRPYPTRRKVRD